MADVAETTDGVMPEVENDEFNFVVTDDVDTTVDQEKVELQTKLAEQEAKMQELLAQNAQQSVANTSQKQMEELANVIKTSMQASQSTPEVADPQAEYLKVVEEARQNWHADPAGNALKLMEPLMQQMQQQMITKVSTLELKTSKIAAVNGPDKSIYEKYGSEVEQMVSSLPPSENVYQDAIKAVKANHMDDLVNDMVNEKLDALLASKGMAVDKSNPSQIVAQADVTLAGQPQVGNAQLAQQQKAQINSSEQIMLKNYAMQHGINWDVPRYRNMLVNAYKANPAKFK